MIYFRKKKIPVDSPEMAEKYLNRSTSKVLSFFDVAQTSAFIISEDYPFIGKQLKSGHVLISRYRHRFLTPAPRIVTKWKVETDNSGTFLVLQTRLNIISFIFATMFCWGLILTVFEVFTRGKDVYVEDFAGTAIIGYFSC